MLQILYSSVRVRLTRAMLIFLREQPDDFFSVGNPERCFAVPQEGGTRPTSGLMKNSLHHLKKTKG